MGRAIDILEATLLDIANDGKKMLSDAFMNGIWISLLDEIPEFKSYDIHV